MPSDVADVIHKTSTYCAPELEEGFAYDDRQVAIGSPSGIELVASATDAAAPALAAIADSLRA